MTNSAAQPARAGLMTMNGELTKTKLPQSAEEMICFAIYSAGHAVNRAYSPLLKALGLTYPQYIALMVLWETDGLSVGALSRRLRMESSTLTPLLKRLERLGHVERRRGVEDERQVFVHLTKSGRALQRRSPEITACIIKATGMDLTRLEELVEALSALRDNMIKAA